MAPPLPPSSHRKKRENPQIGGSSNKRQNNKTSTPSLSSSLLSLAVTAAGQRQKHRQQTSLPFGLKEKFPVGLKILLNETIYPTPSDVSFLVVSICFVHSFLTKIFLLVVLVYYTSNQVPHRARGYLFEYETIEMKPGSAVIRYTGLCLRIFQGDGRTTNDGVRNCGVSGCTR
jgi:hypothetical protein